MLDFDFDFDLSDFFSMELEPDFFSMPFLSCASAAKLVAANIAATRTVKSCFIASSPSSGGYMEDRPLGAVRS